jgi:acyl-CoA thioesterase-1
MPGQTTDQPPAPRSRTRRIGLAAGFGLAAAASLIAFPAEIPWMAAAWIACHTLAATRQRPAWLPLFACLALLLAKRPPWFPGMLLLIIALGSVGSFRLVRRPRTARRKPAAGRIALALLWLAWLAAALDWRAAVHVSRQAAISGNRPIVCLGDSLTASGYPHELGRIICLPVVHRGVDGITTGDALAMLPGILELRPQAIVVELGGHDYLRGHGEKACRRNLERIIESCRAAGAQLVLIEIPRGIASDPFRGLERRLARRFDLELVSDASLRGCVLLSPYAPPGMWLPASWHLSDDGLHPSDRGNAVLARQVRDALVRVFGREIGQGQGSNSRTQGLRSKAKS